MAGWRQVLEGAERDRIQHTGGQGGNGLTQDLPVLYGNPWKDSWSRSPVHLILNSTRGGSWFSSVTSQLLVS